MKNLIIIGTPEDRKEAEEYYDSLCRIIRFKYPKPIANLTIALVNLTVDTLLNIYPPELVKTILVELVTAKQKTMPN